MGKIEYPKMQITEIAFPGGKIVDGHIRPDPGSTITVDEKTGGAVLRMRDGTGTTIDPCECALETGGSCVQVTSEDDDGQINDLWCDSQGCGFCVGGIRPEGSDFALRFTVAMAPTLEG